MHRKSARWPYSATNRISPNISPRRIGSCNFIEMKFHFESISIQKYIFLISKNVQIFIRWSRNFSQLVAVVFFFDFVTWLAVCCSVDFLAVLDFQISCFCHETPALYPRNLLTTKPWTKTRASTTTGTGTRASKIQDVGVLRSLSPTHFV